MYTCFQGTFRCIRCGTDSEAPIQTYLFKTDASNASRRYLVGESEIIDGLEEFFPLHPWNGQTPLVLVVGEWDCRQCGLTYQWAKVTLSVVGSSLGLVGRIESIETLVPREPAALDGVHLVQPDLATLNENYNETDAWSAWSVEQRCSWVVTGFRTWCAEVVGIDIDHEPATIATAGGTSVTPAEAPEDSEERQILCSGCLQAFPESLVHVIPYFNSSVNGYVTTYRCEQCWIPALEETRARLANTRNEAEIASAGALFQRHGVYIHEFLQGNPKPDVQKILLRMIDLLRSEGLRISIGPDIPSLNPSPAELPREGKQASFRLRRWFSAIFGG